ncbi:MAG: hypothetical protein R3F02_22140 [Thiolinea sp.]
MDSTIRQWGFRLLLVSTIAAGGLLFSAIIPAAQPANATPDNPVTKASTQQASTAPLVLAQATTTEKATEQNTAKTTDKIIADKDYNAARWDPIHFKPAIDQASNEDCLKCHQEILDRKVLDTSPAGLSKDNTLAWYQTLDTYEGDQQTFHQRHLTAPFINKVAQMSCTTCHQGNDPREEIPASSASNQDQQLTMRKLVNPDTCLMCHGQFNYTVMGLPAPWHESGELFQNNCLLCHAAIRTNRHQVNFLKPDAIEEAGKASSDSCFGCHGGRAWYRINYPYPRHPWPGMGKDTPDWAKDRLTESDIRFLIKGQETTTSQEQTQ